MTANHPFTPGGLTDVFPEGEVARQAVDSLRGYAYQVTAATLAWLDIGARGRLHLEVAEDYAKVATGVLEAFQVKDTGASGTVTLKSESVRDAIANFVDLVGRNPSHLVHLHYFTTADVGLERSATDRPSGQPGLRYWRQAAADADVTPLRTMLESDGFPEPVRSFVRTRNDAAVRDDLLRRIHWDCGQPDLATLRRELEDRLVVLGRDRFRLPAREARDLADTLIHQTLRKSLVKTPGQRVLTQSDLYETIDRRTLLSLPRGVVDILARLAPGFGGPTPDSGSLIPEDLLIDGASFPTPQRLIARGTLEGLLREALRENGIAILVGGSGLGKSHVARAVLRPRDGSFAIVEFRGADPRETRGRLEGILARLGGLHKRALLLEDIAHFEDPAVSTALGRLVESCHRRDIVLLSTSYHLPSARAAVEFGGTAGRVIACPYFSEDEVRELVQLHGGDSDRWGRLAYMTGAAGHPQLCHAFVVGMAARDWPVTEIRDIVSRGMASDDTDAARDAARRGLAAALPDGTRAMLHRLSMTSMRFDRALALAIGALAPAIAHPGECLDPLIGPWIESASRGLYRVSPLAATFGRDTLTSAEQMLVHRTIAEGMLGRPTVDAGDADAIMIHALAGKSSQALTALAHSVMTAQAESFDLIAEHLSVLSLFRTDRPIFPENVAVSAMLRLAQFRLAAARGEEIKATDVARALLSEAATIVGVSGGGFEAVALMTILNTPGAANFVDDWVELLQRFKAKVQTQGLLQGIRTEVGREGLDLFGMLFAVGTSGLKSVARLEHVVDHLDRLEPTDRQVWLASPQKDLSDHTVMILGPYASQQRLEPFDAEDALLRYGRIAGTTKGWGVPMIPIQCRIVQAVILDENEDDERRAFAVLDEAELELGEDLSFTRERAKIHWRRRRYPEALDLMRGIADTIGERNVVDRAFALREAAISAAKCGDWRQAETWFDDARVAAEAPGFGDMRAMAVGLRADAAVAALRGGDGERALTGLATALRALASLDPDGSLREAYCHRVVRHAVLWAQSHADGGEPVSDGTLADLDPGACSNPSPSRDIRQHPLGSIDLAWYVLAEAENSLGLDIGISTSLDGLLTQGSIALMEAALRGRRMQRSIEEGDPEKFASRFAAHVEVASYMQRRAADHRAPMNLVTPERARIPKLPGSPPFEPSCEGAARDAILAFAIQATLSKGTATTADLEGAMASRFPAGFPGQAIFDHARGGTATLNNLDRTALDLLAAIATRDHKTPGFIWMAGLRLFERINGSGFRQPLTTSLARWLSAKFETILASEAFRLTRPSQTMPPIAAVLKTAGEDRAFIARLLLAAAPAVSMPLGRDLVVNLTEVANDGTNATGCRADLPSPG